MQCGVACLAMVCRAFGARVSLRRLDDICHRICLRGGAYYNLVKNQLELGS